jgi:small subunit ribosomal protein S16
VSVKLRLRRIGRKKIPVYSIVAADQRNARDGRYIEDIGRYFPLREPAEVRLEEDRALYWLENGAQPSDTVRSILRRRGLLLHHHLKKKGESPGEIETAVEEFRERIAEKGEEVKIAVGTRGKDPLERERERAEEIDEEAQLRAQATPLSAVQEEAEAQETEDVEAAEAEDADATSETDAPEAAADEADASADTDDQEESKDE